MYHLPDEGLFAMDKVLEATSNETFCVKWRMEVGLIDRHKTCPLCQLPMRLAPTRKRWRSCRRTKHEGGREVCRGLLTNSFFNESKITLCTGVCLLLAWCMRLPQEQDAELAGTSERSVHQYYAFCRSMCSKELLKSEFKKHKYHQGRHYEEFCLFGGVERGTGRWFGRVVYMYNKRTKATLLPIIKRFIKPRYVEPMNLSNHSENFVDPLTGTQTNTIEGLWETTIKRHIKSMRGMTNVCLDSYLDEDIME
ncbi:hypothetical protein PHMEG_00024092 [Phytophthora megakarya]|uniref:Uncharacterized protein n=1 Tax=Phytophthora megakarya TaxID=4795 RepID=A0A225VHT9_9STRA|nr:hypothetical protein PHMEG_00024092 [Phytophthora megakarya]